MVGRNFLEHKLINSFSVIAPDRNELNLHNLADIKHFLDNEKPDVVVHAAGRVGGIKANMTSPFSFMMDNLIIGQNLIIAAKELGISKLINLGSSCMYPRYSKNRLREEDIYKGELEPTNEGYALAKVTIARLCQYISKEDNQYKYKTVIPCNLYGKYDKYDPHNSHLIPAIIHKVHQAIKLSKPIVEIWGDGTARREFMYAGDFADSLVFCIKNFDKIPPTMNIGLGFDFTIDHYYKTVAEVLGFKGEFRYDLSKPTGMNRKVVDIRLLKSMGWEAKTDLNSGILNAYKDYLGKHGEDL